MRQCWGIGLLAKRHLVTKRYSDDDKNYRLRIVEEDAAIVRHMFECSTKGWGLRRIGAEVGFSDGRVWATLHNENYTGDRVQRNKTNREKKYCFVCQMHIRQSLRKQYLKKLNVAFVVVIGQRTEKQLRILCIKAF